MNGQDGSISVVGLQPEGLLESKESKSGTRRNTNLDFIDERAGLWTKQTKLRGKSQLEFGEKKAWKLKKSVGNLVNKKGLDQANNAMTKEIFSMKDEIARVRSKQKQYRDSSMNQN